MTSDRMSTRVLYTVPHAAEQLDMSERKVRQLIRDGELEAIRLSPRNQRIPHDALVAYVERLRAAAS